MKMQPFTKNTIVILVLIAILFFSFYFWNFSFHPLLNIVLKTGIITVIYLFLIFKFRVSEDIMLLLRKYIK